VTPVEEVLPKEKREAVRAAWLASGGFYSPWLHLGTTSVVGVGLVVAAALSLHGLRWGHLGFGLGTLLFANAGEWAIHKYLLHTRVKPFGLLYDRHTPQHHLVFVTDDMEIRGAHEFRLVLIPAFGIVLAFVGLLPAIAGLWLWDPNLAGVFTIGTIGYVVSYEWLHLVWHLPESSALGRLTLVKVLKRHHALHHDPRLMQRWNFNVTLPLWDLVRGTFVRDPERVLRPRSP